MLIIDMQSQPELVLGRHVHTCPECYEDAPCEDACSVFDDATTTDGLLYGAIVPCDSCEAWLRRRAVLTAGGLDDAREAGW
jgi:hypothetical protein